MKRFALMAVSVFTLFSLAYSPAAHAQRVSRLTGKALGALCTQKKNIALCDAYIAGMTDSEVWARDYALLQHDKAPVAFCVPAEQTTQQIRNIVVAWLGAHHDALPAPAGKGVYRALHENYPCGSTLDPTLKMAPVENGK